MRRYYFDVIDKQGVAFDEEGVVLRDIEAAQQEAARLMADAARDEVIRQVCRRAHPDVDSSTPLEQFSEDACGQNDRRKSIEHPWQKAKPPKDKQSREIEGNRGGCSHERRQSSTGE
jgi:hypothetical protein